MSEIQVSTKTISLEKRRDDVAAYSIHGCLEVEIDGQTWTAAYIAVMPTGIIVVRPRVTRSKKFSQCKKIELEGCHELYIRKRGTTIRYSINQSEGYVQIFQTLENFQSGESLLMSRVEIYAKATPRYMEIHERKE